MDADVEDAAAVGQLPSAARGRHIKKRALKNKALSVSFSEKDLKDYVTGFHKRKKKRRKEARKKQEEADRRKRIEQRKRRKVEREYAIHGGAPPATEMESVGDDREGEEDNNEQLPSVSGTALYDNGDIKVTVTTSEISREEVEHPREKTAAADPSTSMIAAKKHNIPVSKKKPMKKVSRQRSRQKSQKRKDGKKGKNGKKRR